MSDEKKKSVADHLVDEIVERDMDRIRFLAERGLTLCDQTADGYKEVTEDVIKEALRDYQMGVRK